MSLPSNKIDRAARSWRALPLVWRIWLLVVIITGLLIAVLALLWRADLAHERASRPGGEIVVRDLSGHAIGQALAMHNPGFGPPTQFQVITEDGDVLWIELPPPSFIPDWLHGARAWLNVGWVGVIALVGLAFAAAAWPLVRGLTRRLEVLTHGVQRWGAGDLSVRLPQDGSDEVADLARHFNTAAQRVADLVQAHKVLLAHASHELRSPLARIRLGLALLPPDQAQAACDIGREVDELDHLVEEVLLASRLEHNPQDLPLDERVDLVALAAEESARVGAQLHAAGACEITGNAALLRRMLRNLLENARRHGGQGLAIDVDLLDDESTVCLRVADRGPGIPEAWRQRVFEPFARVPGSVETQGSVGLGLALVRLIAQRHGAHASVHARSGGGSVFQLEWKK